MRSGPKPARGRLPAAGFFASGRVESNPAPEPVAVPAPAHDSDTRPSGAREHAPARTFPGGAAISNRKEDRPSGKRPRRPTGFGRDSVAEGVAVGCQVSAFFATTSRAGVLPDEESRTRHAPSEKALADLHAGSSSFNVER